MPVKAGVVRVGTRQTRRGAAETFTGTVFQDPVLVAEAPSRMGGRSSPSRRGRAPPGTPIRSARRSIAFRESGAICFEGEKPQVLNPGDIVNIPPDTMHWHGASPDRCSRIWRLSEAGEQGQGTAWGKHVSDAEYTAPRRRAEPAPPSPHRGRGLE